MNIVMKTIFTILFLALILNISVFAQEAKFLGKFGDWEAFKEFDGKKPICYMGAQPIKSVGKYKKRGETYLLVTHRPAEKIFSVVSLRAGYKFLRNSEPTITIGKKTFNLFSDAGHAFAHDKKSDIALIKAMIRGVTMFIKGTSSRGTKTTDTYSLKGVSAAWRAINKACNNK
jgi:hypothetical protein